MKDIKSVKEIKEYLDRFVVGQEEAKKLISYVGYMHQLRYSKLNNNNGEPELGPRPIEFHETALKTEEGRLKNLQAQKVEIEAALDAALDESVEEVEMEIGIAQMLDKISGEMDESLGEMLNDCRRDIAETLDKIKRHKSVLKAAEPAPKSKFATKKSNGLLIGPSGCGKTYLIQKLGELLDFPVVTINSTQITATGWSGHDIDSYMEKVFKSDHPKKDGTIIFIDEFDKICLPAVGQNGTDLNKQTQYAFLTLLESDKYSIDAGMHRKYDVDTSNLLFLFGGNFEYIRKAEEATMAKNGIGFNPDNSHKEEVQTKSISQKLQDNNVARELAGRISLMASVKDLTRDDLRNILTVSENNLLEEYKELVNVEINSGEIEKILDICEAAKTGARGLRSAVDQIVMDKVFNGEV